MDTIYKTNIHQMLCEEQNKGWEYQDGWVKWLDMIE